MLAARVGNRELVRFLLQRGGDPNIQPFGHGDRGPAALILALDAKHSDTAAELIGAGCDVNIRDTMRAFGTATPLLIAAENEDKDLLAMLRKAGACHERLEIDRLLLALHQKKLEHLDRLISEVGDVNQTGSAIETTPLIEAVEVGNLAAVRALLNAGADPNKGLNTATPLIVAAARGHMDVAKLLVDSGADVDATPKDVPQWSALCAAEASGHREVAKYLRSVGASIPGERVSKQRGAFPVDANQFMLLAKGPVDQVAGIFKRTFQYEMWHKDIGEQKITIVKPSFVVFRFRDHIWSNILGVSRNSFGWFTTKKAQRLSKALHAPVILYEVSDTAAETAYSLYDNGELVEQMDSAKEESRGPSHVDEFFRKHDAFVPPMSVREYPVGRAVVFSTPEFELGEIERIDFVGGRLAR
jgi:ankyrin repeat protein